MSNTLQLIGYALGQAAGNADCRKGPAHLQQSGYLDSLDIHWLDTLKPNKFSTGLDAMPNVAATCLKLAQYTAQLTTENKAFCVIGGDHSSGSGTWSGVAHAKRSEGDIGLIWIDAHMDAHTPESSGSGNIHGMPVATLLGHGDKQLTQLLDEHPKLKPENICQIGIRCYESPEKELLKKLGVKIFFIEDVLKHGYTHCLKEAIAHVTKSTCQFGLSLDLDGLDPDDAPAVGTPVHTGIDAKEVLDTLDLIIQHQAFFGAEIAEFNPTLDIDHTTEKLVADLLKKMTQGK